MKKIFAILFLLSSISFGYDFQIIYSNATATTHFEPTRWVLDSTIQIKFVESTTGSLDTHYYFIAYGIYSSLVKHKGNQKLFVFPNQKVEYWLPNNLTNPLVLIRTKEAIENYLRKLLDMKIVEYKREQAQIDLNINPLK